MRCGLLPLDEHYPLLVRHNLLDILCDLQTMDLELNQIHEILHLLHVDMWNYDGMESAFPVRLIYW